MSRVLWAVFRRDMTLAVRQRAELLQPLVFFTLVISLFPLGIGPGPDMLQKIGPGVIWIAALLSSLLGMERLFREDFLDGSLEQTLLCGGSLGAIALVKVVAHWLTSSVPVLLMSPLLAFWFNLTSEMYWALLATMALGTPLLSLVGAIAVGLTVGLQRGGVLLSLLLLPMFIPLLIFATSAVDAASMQLPYNAQMAIIGAMLLFSLALAPLAIAFALKVSHN